MAFFGTPVEALEDEFAEEAITGAMLVAAAIDDMRTLRLEFQGFLKALSRKK